MGYRSVGYRSVPRFPLPAAHGLLPAARGLLPAALCPLPATRPTLWTATVDCHCKLQHPHTYPHPPRPVPGPFPVPGARWQLPGARSTVPGATCPLRRPVRLPDALRGALPVALQL